MQKTKAENRFGMLKIIKIILLFLMACFALAIFCGICYQYYATKRDDARYPAPGTLVSIGNYKIHLYTTGSGKPTVILDAGLTANLTWWALVQKEVANFARVCSFDRPGYGWSDAGKEPRTSKVIVNELHTALHATADTPPPYILVGHSFGGATMRLYANTFPDEVCGLVLVDACHEKQYQNNQAQIEHKTFFKRLKDYFLEGPFAHCTGITRWYMAEAMQPYFSDRFSDDQKNTIIAKASTVKYLMARDSEWTHIHKSLAQIQKSANMLTNKPVMVISRGKDIDTRWMAYQKDLAALSQQGKLIVAHKSGHMINVEQPDIIVDAIRELVTKQQNEKGK